MPAENAAASPRPLHGRLLRERPAPRMTAPPGAVGLPVLRHRRRSLALWSLAVGALAAMYIAFWPSFGADADVMASYVDALPGPLVEAMGLQAITTPAGYLASTVYGIICPALLLVLAVGSGAQLIAAAEEDGTLELELTSPASRRQVYLERLLALWASLVAVVAVVTAVVLAVAAAAGMDVAPVRVLAISSGLLALAVAMGTLALATGAATGRRTVALAVGAGLAVVSYVAHALGTTVESAGWLTDVSPWSWYVGGAPLTTGFDVVGLLLLAGLTVVAALAGLLAFERRDLMV